MKIIGIDLSLAATGIGIVIDGHPITPVTITTSSATDLGRLREITSGAACCAQGATLAVIEGPAHSRSGGAGHHLLAGLWWHLRHKLDRAEIPVAVVPPTSLKKWATGKGNAAKETVLIAALRRFPGCEIRNNNEADATWLACAGAHHLGCLGVTMPATNRAALDVIDWPQVTL